METGAVDAPLTRRPTLASSWDAACGALAQSLRLARAGLGARDADWEQLLAPPATGCAARAGAGAVLRDSHAPGWGAGRAEGLRRGLGAELVTGLGGARARGQGRRGGRTGRVTRPVGVWHTSPGGGQVLS